MEIKTNAVIQTINTWTGEIVKETKTHNKIVDTGLDRVADLVADVSNTGFGVMAIGTDNTAPQATDTQLGTEVKRESVTPTDEGTGIIEYDHTFSFSSGESFTITEYGLFDSLTVSGSTMFNRLTDSGHAVNVDNSLRVIITITVTSGT